MMTPLPIYKVLLLPSREVASRACSLSEAAAWVRAYNQIMEGESEAVIGEEQPVGINSLGPQPARN